MFCMLIIILTAGFLQEVYASRCTAEELSMCSCEGTKVFCEFAGLTEIPINIPKSTTKL